MPSPSPALEDLLHISEGLRSLVIPIDSVHEDPLNARKHTDANMKAIKASLGRFGQQKPIVFTAADRIIRAGNGTWAAARELGWRFIAANGTTLTVAEAAAYGLVDNKSGDMAEWNFANLSTTLRGLLDAKFDLGVTGFQTFELTPLLQASYTPVAVEGELEGATEAGASGAKTLRIPAELVPTVMGVFSAIRASRQAVEPKMTDLRALEVLCHLWTAGSISADPSQLPSPPPALIKLQQLPVPITVNCPTCRVPITIEPTTVGVIECPTCKVPVYQVTAARAKSSPKGSV